MFANINLNSKINSLRNQIKELGNINIDAIAEYKEENETDRLHIYGYVDNVHIMMSAADIFVSKPGGISATEAFMKDLPMVIINPLAGQEERNAEFMMNCGLALQATKTFTLDEAVNLLINDKIMIEEITDVSAA